MKKNKLITKNSGDIVYFVGDGWHIINGEYEVVSRIYQSKILAVIFSREGSFVRYEMANGHFCEVVFDSFDQAAESIKNGVLTENE